MWFLQVDILIRMLLACAVAAAALAGVRIITKKNTAPHWFLLLDLVLITYVSKRLAVFYVGYLLVTYGFVLLLEHIKTARKICFVMLCLACLIPFLYGRATAFFSMLPVGVVMVGIAYNMLKAIDALYYQYYTEEHIPFLLYANFLLFFPVLTAGPIFRYRDFKQTFEHAEAVTFAASAVYVKRMIRGMFKKVVVLVLVMKLLNHIVAMNGHWYLSIAAAALSYLTLYLDMSGYADIAIGMGGFMGIRIPENFKNPLRSPSFTQFWRNWHITLSDWIREHIFVVVSGKRLNRWQGALIGFFSMFFMCLWHGFSWAYLIDGILLGSVLAVENLCGITTVNRRKVKRPYYIFRCVITNIIFALNSLLLTLGAPAALQILRNFFVW